MPGLNDLQRADQLLAGESGPPLVKIGKCCQRLRHVLQRAGLLQCLAVAGLHGPDGKDDVAADTEALLDHVEKPLVLLRQATAVGDGLLVDAVVHVVPRIVAELGLEAGRADHVMIGLGHAGEDRTIGLPADAVGGGRLLEVGDPALKAGIRQGGHAGAGQKGHGQERGLDEASSRWCDSQHRSPPVGIRSSARLQGRARS